MSIEIEILRRFDMSPTRIVWIVVDFLDLGKRNAIDKALQRLVKANRLRRISRGLYDKPKVNTLTGKLEAPDYQKIVEAIARRDQFRILIDGLTAANDIGLTNIVPGQVNILTDGRLRTIRIHNLTITFRHTAPSKLYWASRPAMRIVQALHWLRDVIISSQSEYRLIRNKLIKFIKNSKQRELLLNDLHEGLFTLPMWMQTFLKDVFISVDKENNEKNK